MTKQVRRKTSSGTVLKEGEYERSNGTFRYHYKDESGKAHDIYAKTLKELREKEKTVTLDVMQGIRVDGRKVTVSDMYERWKSTRLLDVKAELLRETTYSNYCYMFEMFALPIIGGMKVADVTKAKIDAMYKHIITTRGVKVNTVDSIHTPTYQVFDLALDANYIRKNPAAGAMSKIKAGYKKKQTGQPSAEKALTREEQDLFLNYMRTHEESRKWLPVFTVALFTGMRVGELTGLRWDDVDFEAKTLTVNHTLVYYTTGEKRKTNYAINDTKTPAGKRVIPMLPIVKEALEEERERQQKEGISCKSDIDGYTNFIFLNRFGNVMNYAVLNKAIRRIIRDCNFEQVEKNGITLPGFSSHWLRHTHTTRLIESGVNVRAAMALLGHSSSDMTLSIYASCQPEFAESELSKIVEDLPTSYQ